MKRVSALCLSIVLASAIACALPPAAAAERARLTREAPLRTDRFVDAEVITMVPAGAEVDWLRSEAGWAEIRVSGRTGWVRPAVLGGLGLPATGAAAASPGRLFAGNTELVATGIRGVPRASRHALIIAIARYADDQVPALPGVQQDVVSATRLARAMLVPDANVRVLRDRDATAAGIEAALADLGTRVQEGDRVFVYYSGHGTRWLDPAAGECVEALLAYDGQPVANDRIAALLAPLAERADKLMVFYDACHSGGVAGRSLATRSAPASRRVTPKFAPAPSNAQCASPSNVVTRSLGAAAERRGLRNGNYVFIAAARADQVSFDDAEAGGFATTAWRDCALGGAVDLDGSGALSVDEIRACAQARMEAAFADVVDFRPSTLTVAGNEGLVPASFSAPPAVSAGSSGPSDPVAVLQDVLAQRDPRQRVDVRVTGADLRIGRDKLDLAIDSAVDGYLYLVLLGTDQKSLYLLFPNELDADNRIRAGETLRLPRAQWSATAGGPPGTNTLLAIVSRTRRDFRGVAGERVGPFVRALTDERGKADLQWLLTSGAASDSAPCQANGALRNLMVARECSDAFGAALLEIREVP